MQQVAILKYGSVEHLSLIEKLDEIPLENQVRIRVKASGVNFADILARKGMYPAAPPLPSVVGYEVSGSIDAVGENVSEEWLGKAVIALCHFQGYADTVYVPLQQIFLKPERLTFEQAAALPVNYLTAWQLLVVVGSLSKEETILIQNVGGGVGLAALQIAKHIGAKTIGTASQNKHDFLKTQGLDHAVDYRKPNWSKMVMQHTQNKGVELIIDPLGSKSWKESYALLRSTGRMGIFGISEVTIGGGWRFFKLLKEVLTMPKFKPLDLMDKNKSVFGVNLGNLWDESEKVALWMNAILKGVEEGWINPTVDTTFPLSKVGEAHTYIENRKNKGKVVLVV